MCSALWRNSVPCLLFAYVCVHPFKGNQRNHPVHFSYTYIHDIQILCLYMLYIYICISREIELHKQYVYTYMYIYLYTCMFQHSHIYIERERIKKKNRKRGSERERERQGYINTATLEEGFSDRYRTHRSASGPKYTDRSEYQAHKNQEIKEIKENTWWNQEKI